MLFRSQQYPEAPGHLALARSLVRWNKKSWLGLRGAKEISPGVLAAFSEYEGPEILAEPWVYKRIRDERHKREKAAIQVRKLSEPEEWRNGRIVLPQPPAKPLKGTGSERIKPGGPRSLLTKKVSDWFVQKLDDAHKALVSGYGSGKSAHISPEAAELLRSKSVEWLWLMEEDQKAVKKQVAKAAASAGMSKGELKAKLDRLSELAAQDNLQQIGRAHV